MRWLVADMAAVATGAAVRATEAAVVAHMGAAAAAMRVVAGATPAARSRATLAMRVTARLRGAKVRPPLILRPRQPTPASQFHRPRFMAARSWFAPPTQCRLAHGAYRREPLFSVAGIRIVFMRRPPPSRL